MWRIVYKFCWVYSPTWRMYIGEQSTVNNVANCIEMFVNILANLANTKYIIFVLPHCFESALDNFYVRNEVAKVMFLHLSVILFTGGSASVHTGIPPRPGADPPGTIPPPADGYCCRRYASYWNAFLLKFIIIKEQCIHTIQIAVIQRGIFWRIEQFCITPNIFQYKFFCFCFEALRGKFFLISTATRSCRWIGKSVLTFESVNITTSRWWRWLSAS